MNRGHPDGWPAGGIQLLPRTAVDTERERRILDHPDSVRLALELYQMAIGDLERGADPGMDPRVINLQEKIAAIGGELYATLYTITLHDSEVMELSQRYVRAFTGEIERRGRERRSGGP
ncbi:hypothetical protein [Methanomassiliicoccus luminyensis]|uniref:hypothetical protein n=1 Tax=Methanomassiliicoccus luminyensis TaxID=1080712 RepID=UPI00037CF720|nr:hypothetical protein [Methanomassiliicoccus luminyensis]